jgi:hypothetical protein
MQSTGRHPQFSKNLGGQKVSLKFHLLMFTPSYIRMYFKRVRVYLSPSVSRPLLAIMFKRLYLNVTSKRVGKNSWFRFFKSKEQM